MKIIKKTLSISAILIFIIGLPIRNLNSNKNQNNQTDFNYGLIIDQEDANYYSGATIDSDLDGDADTLYMWGKNDSGQIGDGTKNDVTSGPIEIFPNNKSWNGNLINLELGDDHSAITVDTNYDGYADTLYMWGDNSSGQLGNGGVINSFSYPQKIVPQNQINWKGKIIDLSLGTDFSGVIIDTNLDNYGDTLYMWGNNSNGQLGNGNIENLNYPKIITPQNESWNGNLIDLELGEKDSALTIDTNYDGYADTLYMWGSNEFLQLGQEDSNLNNQIYPTITEPNNINGFDGNILDLSTSKYSSGVIIDNNLDNYGDTLYMWGTNINGVIGNNIDSNITPTIISSFPGNLIKFVTKNQNSGVTVDTDLDGYADTLYMWGDNQYGEAGTGDIDQNVIYTPIEILPYFGSWEGDILNYAIGDTYASVVVDRNYDQHGDTLYMWGSNQYGEIGLAPSPNVILPNDVFNLISYSISELLITNNNDHGLNLRLSLNDYWDIFNINNLPEVTLYDQYNSEYSLTYLEDLSNPDSDLYYFEINDLNSGTKYIFEKIKIDQLHFHFPEIIAISDYYISGMEVKSIGTNDVVFDLDLILADNLNISYFDFNERKVRVNFSNDTYQEALINNDRSVKLINLTANTNYQITSIDYFYQDQQYKYNLVTDMAFKTLAE
ncbi:MAG: hypothetical protein HPPSJP_2550 [Candidatus Hepatoplasma scabrum]|nr:MAG: hypothetical protein HPPSJP_2550 [Candidatus Hepatoplasma sp.]